MENINDVTFEVMESKATLYNKTKAIVKVDKGVHVIDCSQAKTSGEEAIKSSLGPMARITELENKVNDLTERLNDLEDIVTKVLAAY